MSEAAASMFASLRRALVGGALALFAGISGAADIAVAQLPPEGRQTLALIKSGGPFPYRKDGTVFRNFEKRLPLQPRGYYREYTVPTPGARNRGARRIVAGEGRTGDVRSSGEYYYTPDHYQTFQRIRD